MKVDYDVVAKTYDRRFVNNDYSGVERVLAAFVGHEVGLRVLEIGCGTGHWLERLRGGGSFVAGVDRSAPMLLLVRAQGPGANVVRAVAEHLPWPDACFDRIVCINALHHFDDKPKCLREARRVLRSRGRVMTIGLDPHVGIDRWYLYDYFEGVDDTDRRRYPAAAHIRAWMETAGFADCATEEAQHLLVRIEAATALAQGRLDRHATSQLSLLPEAAYQRGLDRIRRAMASADAAGETLYLSADLRLYATVGSVSS